jgi:putative transposase
MAIRKFSFTEGEVYHCYNRGVDKRTIFENQQDFVYFLKMLRHFNTSAVMGNLRLLENKNPVNPPVTILSYCLLPNHYHLILRCEKDNDAFSKYMQRIGGGYTMYFNQKYNRSGALFQGKFKANHIDTDEYLRHILAYVSHNYVVHDISDKNLYRASLNTNDSLVRGLASNYDSERMMEIAHIINEIRSTRQGLEL